MEIIEEELESSHLKFTFPHVPWINNAVPKEIIQKKRGRPKKFVEPVDGTTIHKSDIELEIKHFSIDQRKQIQCRFEDLQKDNVPTKQSIETIASEYECTYRQIYEIVGKLT